MVPYATNGCQKTGEKYVAQGDAMPPFSAPLLKASDSSGKVVADTAASPVNYRPRSAGVNACLNVDIGLDLTNAVAAALG